MKLSDLKCLEVIVDGGSKGNGDKNEGYGSYQIFAIDQQDKRTMVRQESRIDLGKATSNEAEWRMMLKVLNYLHSLQQKMGKNIPAIVHSDSDLVVGQLNRTKQCKAPHLKPLYEEGSLLYLAMPDVVVEWIGREVVVEFLGH